MRYSVLRSFLATILVCTVPLRVEAERSSLPQLHREIRALPIFDGQQVSPVIMNRAVSLNDHYAPGKLLQPTTSLGRMSCVLTLWLHTELDTYCNPALSKQMHQPFTPASENPEYKLLPRIGRHGHFLVHLVDPMAQSAPLIIDFLERHP